MDENTPERFRSDTPWNQLPDETDTAYHRFTVYLEMGADRSIPKVREKTGKSQGYDRHLYRWSSQYNWVDRCRAYDQHIAFQYVENQEVIQKKARSEILRRLPEAVDKLYDIALSDDPDRMSALEMIMQQAGMINQQEETNSKEMPTYQQINNYFAKKLNKDKSDPG